MADGSRHPRRTAEARVAAEIEAAKALREALGSDADDQELLADMVEGQTSLFEMVDAIYAAMRDDQMLIDGIKAREDELAKRKRRLSDRYNWRKAKIEQALMVFEESIERPEATFTLARRPAKTIVTDEALIPSGFWEMKPKLDLKALGDALKSGEPVPGAVLSNQTSTLSIRTK